MRDVELYTVILNPLNTILTLDWTMHLHNVVCRNSPKFNEIQCIVCAGKLVFLTMHSFSFLFKTLLICIYFDLIFLNIAWVFWIYFSSSCNRARAVVSWLNLYDKMGLWAGGGYSGVGARRDPGLIAHARPVHLLNQSRALEFQSSGYLLAFFPSYYSQDLCFDSWRNFYKFLAKPAFSNAAVIEAFKNLSVRYLEKPSKLTALVKQQRWSLQVFPLK